MRWLLLLLVLAGVGSWGYVRWFRADPIGEGDEIGKLGRDGASELGDPLVPPAPPPGGVEEEIRVLEDRLAGTTSPDGDRDRFRIASLLLVSDDADSITRGEEFLREIYRGDGEYAPRAAAALLQREEGEAAIEYARYIREAGPEASGYAEACLASGLERLRQGDEGASIEAWRLLSEAYFARQEASWRDAVRKELDPLVEALILSPRFNSACITHTVKEMESLSKIARAHGTTIGALRLINALKSDTIHPGQRLKVLKGTVTLEVTKSSFRLDARLDGAYLFSALIGHGKFGNTPTGEFVIDLRQEKPDWQPRNRPRVPYGHPDNPLGERWLGFQDNAEQAGYGIHGTDEPESIGTESSEGCIRLMNQDIIRLYALVPVGTRVIIRE